MSDQVQVAGFVVIACMALAVICVLLVLGLTAIYEIKGWVKRWTHNRRYRRHRDAERHRLYMERQARDNAQPLTTAVEIQRAA